MVFDGLLQVVVFVLEESQKTGNILLNVLRLLAFLNESLNVPHDIVIDLLVTDLFLHAFLKHLSLLLESFDRGYLILVPTKPSVNLQSTL